MNKLAIDLSYQSGGGTLKHIQELINNIKYYEFDEIIFLVAKDNMEMLESITDSRIIVKKLFFSKKSIVVRTIWIQLILPLLIILYNIDVLFCAGNISPIIKLCKKVQWIHTIGPFEAQIINCYRFAIKIKLYISRYLIIKSASTSDTVIYESIYTKNIIEQNYNLNLNNSIVIHTGKDSYYYPYNAEYINIDGQQYNYEYIFTISHLYPYKNIELLIEAFYRLSLHEKGIKLLIAGAIMDKLYFEKLKSIVSGYGISNNIIFLRVFME